MIYASKKDRWLVICIGLSLLITFAAAMLMLFLEQSQRSGLLALFILVAGWAPFLLVFPVRYSISRGSLHVRSGFLQWWVPLEDILAVRPTREIWSSPALSLDRLSVVYRTERGTKKLMISPDNKEAFLQELLMRDPDLGWRGHELIRAGEPA